MKKNIAVIVCTAVLAVGSNPAAAAQPQRVDVEVLAVPALAPEPPDVPETPSAAVANNFGEAVGAYQLLTEVGGQGSSSRAGRALVIPKETGDPKEFAETEEDLNVMARILEKAASGRDDKYPHAMGIAIQGNLFASGSSSAPKNLYIDGHGALFFLNVGFPLLAPASKSPEADDKEKTSTEWEEARRELYQKPGSGFQFNWTTASSGGPGEEYDADKVEDLKRDLTAALKNASHIRKLKSDETVTVVVSGRIASGETRVVRRSGGSGGGATAGGEARTLKKSSGGSGVGSSSSNARTTYAFAKSGGGEGRGTKLILRARKADIDSFQKDKLNLEDFRKKVTMIVY